MPCGSRPRRLVVALACALLLVCAHGAAAQERDEFDETAADPVKLFNRGQEAHAKKDFERALELYEEALQVKPDFAEAEFQKAAALVALKRVPEAEKSYRRSMELRPTWAMPPAAFGLLLVRTPGREKEAEPLLRRALELDAKNLTAVVALAELRARAGDASESATFWRRATELKPEDATLWVSLARAELNAKDSAGALKSFGRAVEAERRCAPRPRRPAHQLRREGARARRRARFRTSGQIGLEARRRRRQPLRPRGEEG
jgi:tetratricopeptide (TPR) repeat protein